MNKPSLILVFQFGRGAQLVRSLWCQRFLCAGPQLSWSVDSTAPSGTCVARLPIGGNPEFRVGRLLFMMQSMMIDYIS